MSLFVKACIAWRGEKSVDIRFLTSKKHAKHLYCCIKYSKAKNPNHHSGNSETLIVMY